MAPACCARPRAARAESRGCSSAGLRPPGSGSAISWSSVAVGGASGAAGAGGPELRETKRATTSARVANTTTRHRIGAWLMRRSTGAGSGVQRGPSRSVVCPAPDSAARIATSADCICCALS